jgi:hypothetical protein
LPLRSRSRALVSQRAEPLLGDLLHVLLLLCLTLLQDTLCLLHHLLLRHVEEFSFALLFDRLGLLLHLQLHVTRGGFLLGLELLQRKEVYQLLVLLIPLHELLRIAPVCVHFALNFLVNSHF